MLRKLLIISLIVIILFIFWNMYKGEAIWNFLNKLSIALSLITFIMGFFAGERHSEKNNNITQKKATLFNSNNNQINQ